MCFLVVTTESSNRIKEMERLVPPHTWPRLGSTTNAGAQDELFQPPVKTTLLARVRSGAAQAIYSVLHATALQPQYVPQIFDEHVVNLGDVFFDGSLPGVIPIPTSVTSMVHTMFDKLLMDVPDIVIAMALLESLVVKYPGIVKTYSVRPLLLATSMLAKKLSCDNTATVLFASQYLDPVYAARAELQLLLYLNWDIPIHAEVYERHKRKLEIVGSQID